VVGVGNFGNDVQAWKRYVAVVAVLAPTVEGMFGGALAHQVDNAARGLFGRSSQGAQAVATAWTVFDLTRSECVRLNCVKLGLALRSERGRRATGGI
jgi:hypothetical protein